MHSDLKPGNVFITGEEGTAKILDFGIARAVPSMKTEASRDVFDAGSLGAYTEAYATDEMIDGVDPHPADDMYALGIIAYELLTGFHPYQRHSAPAARKLGIKPAQLKGLRRKETRAIERCLSSIADRPQNAGEFLKLFRGVTALQKATLAAAAVLALVAGYVFVPELCGDQPRDSVQRAPRLRSRQSSTTTWRKVIKRVAVLRARSASRTVPCRRIDFYAEAYNIHPRNRDAVAGLKKAADALLELPYNEQNRQSLANDLHKKSIFYQKYAPVVEAMR